MNGEVQLEPSDARNPTDSDPLLENQTDSPVGRSSEIRDDDLEGASIPCCRICLECDGESDDELISPCMCKGTQEFVHRHCLDHWRSVKEGFAFSHCTTCKAQFHLRVSLFEDNSWRKMKFRLFVARDVFLVFVAVQTVIAAIGSFVYLMDKDGTFRNSFSDGWDRILSKHPIPFYYCIEAWNTKLMVTGFDLWSSIVLKGALNHWVNWSWSIGFLCHAWIFWAYTTLLRPQQQRPADGWLPELLLWMGNLGLLSCLYGSVFCVGNCFCCDLRYSRYCLWLSCCYYGNSKNLAKTLPHPHQEGAHSGIHSGGSSWFIHSTKTRSRTRRAVENAQAPVIRDEVLNLPYLLEWFNLSLI